MPDRIQREVEELLESLEQFPPKKPARRRLSETVSAPFRAFGNWVSGLNLPSISAGHVLLAAIAIIVIAFVIGGDSGGWQYVIAGGIVLFIAAFILSLRRQSKPAEKYWRDEPLDLRRRGGGSQRGGWFGRRNRR
jgi:hypothetical protein